MVGNIYIYACFTSNTVVIECLLTLCPSPISGHMSKCPWTLNPDPLASNGAACPQRGFPKGINKVLLIIRNNQSGHDSNVVCYLDEGWLTNTIRGTPC